MDGGITQIEIDQRIYDLYDEYCHGRIDRRSFLAQASVVTVGGLAMAQALMPRYANAQTISFTDERIKGTYVTYPSPGGTSGQMRGYLVQPKGNGPFPVVLVIHENRGLNPHIRDVTRRMALAGYLAFGVDLLSPEGGTPADEDKARDMIAALDRPATLARAVAAVAFLAAHPASTGNVGAVGFCWGGGLVNLLAEASPELKAGVAYYGMQPPLDRVPDIKAALLLHYAGLDNRVNEGIAAYEDALAKAGKDYAVYVYEGANHAFNNDANPARYDAKAAELAWTRTSAFLARHLGVPPPVET